MANKQIRVLLVEDNPGDVRLIKELLSQEDAQKDGASFHLEYATRLSTALERVSSGDIDVLLLYLGLPDSQGFDTYRRLHAKAPEVPIVVLTDLDDVALATRIVREGAQDYLGKSRLDGALLRRSIRYSIERSRADKRIRHLNSALRAIRNVNQLIVVEKDRTTLLQKTCNALVAARGYDAAWIAFSEDGQDFAMVVSSGPGEKHPSIPEYVISSGLTPCIKTMLAQQEKLLFFHRRTECEECPVRSAYAGQVTAVVRIEHAGRSFGLLAISLVDDIAAHEEEQSLLTEIAGDLAIALRNIELEEARKRADQAVRESEKKFRDLAALLPQVVYETDARGNLTFVNRKGLDAFGYTQEDFAKGLNTLQMLVPEDHPKAREAFQRTLHGEEARGHEYTALRKDGSTFPVALYSSPIIHEGEPAGLRGIIVDISEHKQAEVALRYERDRAQKYLDVAGVMLVALNSEGEVTLLNARGCQILGCTQEEALGKNWFDLFMPERLQHDVRSVFVQLMAGQIEPFEYFENPVVTRSGEERLIAWHNTVLTDPAGNIVGTLGSGEDITERIQAEEALRKSNEAMSLLCEAGRSLSRTLDLDTLYAEMHDLISRVMDCDTLLVSSYTPEDRLIRCDRAWHAGKPFPVSQLPPIPLEPEGHGSQSVVIRTGQPLLIRDYPERLRQTKTVYFVDEKGRTEGDKDYVPSDMPRSALMVPLKLKGQVVGVIKVASYAYDAYTQDDLQLLDSLAAQIALALRNATLYQKAQNEISNRIQAQEALRESEERFRQMAEVIPAVFWMFSGDKSQALYVSPAFEQVHGRSPESIYENPQSWLDDIHPEDREVVARISEEHRGKPYETEYRIIRPDGSVRWIHNHVLPVVDEAGEIIRIVGLSEDITERKLAEEELRQRHDQLERFNAMAVDRELRMIKQKQEINALLQELGQEARYETIEGAPGEADT